MSPVSLILLIATVLLNPAQSSASSAGSRSLLREVSVGGGGDRSTDFAVELNASTFDAVLRETPASFAVVEFFAHWCPACRNYKPHYEKVARLFNGPDAAHPGMILMTRVDCALKINNKLCDKFSVSHYPVLFWGRPSKFAGAGYEPKQEKSEIQVIDDGRTADHLLNWINKKIGSSYGLDDEKFENEHLPSNITEPEKIARAVYDIEEATTTAFDIIFEHKMIKSETRAYLIKFLQLLVAHHPSKRCRKGSAKLLVNFDDVYPSQVLSVDKPEVSESDQKGLLSNVPICGKEVPRGYWMFCRGSKNDTRGFSCGLWILLHSLSVRVDDGESQFAFNAICDFIRNFFICEECRRHFDQMCSSVSRPFKTSGDFALWLWSAHNQVNSRLMKEEAALGTGDPKFPKIVWPPKQLCPSCYRSKVEKNGDANQINWDNDMVFKFLAQHYGSSLVSVYNSKDASQVEATVRALEDLSSSPSTAIVVPLGAALAIAIASCAFGALACYWRSQQKNRKPRRSWN